MKKHGKISMNQNYETLIRTFDAGFDIGNTFWGNLHQETDMLSRFDHKDLRLLAPSYFIKILRDDLCRKYAQPNIDPDGLFQFMGIPLNEGYEEKIILYHKDYTLFKDEKMYHELDLSIFSNLKFGRL